MKTGFVALAVAVLAIAACGPKYQKPVEASQVGFAVSFFKNVNASEPKTQNVVVSPYSAAVTLSMLAEGAEGQTKAEFNQALGNILYKAADLGNNDTVVVKSANSVWISDNFSPRNRYVSLLEKDFDAFIDVENFASPVALEAINNWCSENTDGKIKGILDRLDRNTVMVLVNALYFQTPWDLQFNQAHTTDQIFHGLSGDKMAKLMQLTGYLMYAEYKGVQIVQLPYQGRKYSMYVILPPKGSDIGELISQLDASAYHAALDMLSAQRVKLFLPRFKAETSMILNKPLQDMGIRTAFTSAADFSGIAEMGPLELSKVKQKCYIDVTESGTEAAAVTAATIRITGARPSPYVEMRVDRPFAFVIADAENRNILFAGKIVNL